MLSASFKTGIDAPNKRASRIVLALIIVLIASVLTQGVVALIITFVPHIAGGREIAVSSWLGTSPVANFLVVLLFESMSVGVIVWFAMYRRVSFWELSGLRKPRPGDLSYAALGFLIYFVAFAVVLFVAQHLFSINTTDRQVLGFDTNVKGGGRILAFITLVVLPPFAEEIVFRGFFYGVLRANNMRIAFAILTTSLLFGSLHLFGGRSSLLWLAFLDTTVLSLMLCTLRELRGSIWAGIGVHMIKNCLVFINLFIIGVH